MRILGIACLAHDTAAALIVDGQLVAFVEEERLNRDKHTWSFPDNAIEWCLKQGGLGIDEIDLVTFDYRPGLDYARAIAFDVIPHFPRSLKHLAYQTYADLRHVWKVLAFKHRWKYRGDVRLVEHHRAHAGAAFLSSPFEEATAITIDRGGDYLSTAVFDCRGTDIKQVMKVRNPHSLGELYSAVTWWLGFIPNWDEGKVMALAPYGRPTYVDEFRNMLHLRDDGTFRIDLSWGAWHVERGWLSARFFDRFGPPRRSGEPLEERHEDVAYALQAVTEEAALHVARAAARRAGASRNLCLGGGVALNSVMNARLLADGPFDEIFMQPAVGDAGNSLGAALLSWHERVGKPREWQMDHASWGPEYSDAEIESALRERKLDHRRVEDPADEAARLMTTGKIVAWFQGRAVMGPRALGNRSILADPRSPDMKDIINAHVKHREPFRPFAPSVLAEHDHEWFEDAYPSPFMLLVLPIKRKRLDLVPAVSHVDGTGRLQTVTEGSNPLYYRLIRSFHRRTGVPVVLNTSFNDKGEPIVCSPDDALRTYFGTGLDALVIGPFVLEKGAAGVGVAATMER